MTNLKSSIGALILMCGFVFSGCVPEATNSNKTSTEGENSISAGPTSNNNGFPNNVSVSNCQPEAGEAVICGKLTAADGVTPVVGAVVSMVKSGNAKPLKQKSNKVDTNLDPDKDYYQGDPDALDDVCRTDANGNFACGGIVEEGKTTIEFKKEGEVEKRVEKDIKIDRKNDIEEKVEKEEHTAKWLVVKGHYDGVQALLAQLKGCKLLGDPKYTAKLDGSLDCEQAGLTVIPHTEMGDKLGSVAALGEYDFVFINCPVDTSAYASQLESYVDNGGHVYYSDWAHDGLDAAFPGRVYADPGRETKVGKIQSQIKYSGLSTYLETKTFPVTFDYSYWIPITGIAADVEQYISGNTQKLNGDSGAPLSVGWRNGVEAGCVFFTSFHIEGASTGSQQERSLKYLIQNLNQVCSRN